MTYDEYTFAERCMSRSPGHCMTMGTASTMACMVESLGMCLSGAAAIPAVDSRIKALAHLSGRRIVEMVKEDLRISKILTRKAFENAIKVNVMVLKMVGPVGYPGMPEVGNMTLPKKLLDQGVTDTVRISDGRMSGTAYGTVVLHVSPESAIGGNLVLVQNGDTIELDVSKKRIHLDVSDEELEKRRKNWKQPPHVAQRGYVNLYVKHVLQADKGADFDFLVGKSGSRVTRDSH